jgi:hypothetical protein
LKSEGNTWGVEVEMRGMLYSKEKENKNKEELIKKERDITMSASSVPTFNWGASISNAAVWCYS